MRSASRSSLCATTLASTTRRLPVWRASCPRTCPAAIRGAPLRRHARPTSARPSVPGNVAFLDLSNLVCTATECPPVIGGVFVYLDNNHLTATYARSMSPLLGPEAARFLGW